MVDSPFLNHSLLASPQAAFSITAAIVTFVAILVTTKLTTGRPELVQHDKNTCQAYIPSWWFPFLGHMPQMTWNAEKYMSAVPGRIGSTRGGAFTLKLAGNEHTFVRNHSLVEKLMDNEHATLEDNQSHFFKPSHGLADDARKGPWKSELQDLHTRFFLGPIITDLIDKMARNGKTHIADLVTFNSYWSDQMHWERHADVEVIEDPSGERYVEADFFPLVWNFVIKTTNPAFFGPDLDRNFEDIPQLLWDLQAGASASLLMRLPSWLLVWIPWPTLHKARRARRVLLSYLEEYHEATEKSHQSGEEEEAGIKWQDLDEASKLVKERNVIFRKHKAPLRARAAADLALMLSTHTIVAPLTFWLLYEVLRDPVLLQQIRGETASYIRALQPKNEFNLGVWVPPMVEHLDVDGLATRCPRLRASYVETTRLHNRAWLTRRFDKTSVLRGNDSSEPGYVIEAGSYVHAPMWLHNLDNGYFPNPHNWDAWRHLQESNSQKGSPSLDVDSETIAPPGEGFATGLGGAFSAKGVMLYVALVLTMFEIEPASKDGSWSKLGKTEHTLTSHPLGKCKVRIKKRELAIIGE